MSPDKQQVRIAEACGFDGIFKDDDGDYCGHKPHNPRNTEWVKNVKLPDYLNDLSAIKVPLKA